MSDSTNKPSNSLKEQELKEDEVLLTIWRELTERKLQWGSYSTWTNKNYIVLSKRISELSKITISSDTLKRIFGKIKTEGNYTPQLYTKNAIAMLHGYNTWLEFRDVHLPPLSSDQQIVDQPVLKESHEEQVSDEESVVHEPGLIEAPIRRKNRFLPYIVGFFLVAVAFLGYRSFNGDDIRTKLEGNGLSGHFPLTASISYELTGVKDTGLYLLALSEAISRKPHKIYIQKSKDTVTYPIMEPGFYTLNLMSSEQIYGSLKVDARTYGWAGYFATTQIFSPGKYINGVMGFSKEQIKAYINPYFEYWCTFANVKKFNIVVDNMSFSARIMNSEATGGIKGYDVAINLQGEKSSISLMFVEPGSWFWTRQKFSERILSGKKEKIEQFGQDLSRWRNVRVTCKDKICSVYIDNVLIYNTPYKEEIGMLRGIVFETKGCGLIDDVIVSDSLGRNIYNESFQGLAE